MDESWNISSMAAGYISTENWKLAVGRLLHNYYTKSTQCGFCISATAIIALVFFKTKNLM